MSTSTLTRATARVAATRPLRVAVYVRISDDKAGDAHGVTKQRALNLARAEREGWVIVPDGDRDVFEDNSISAYSGKRRPAYERLLAAIEAGLVDVVLAWAPDRLHRHPRELETFIDLIVAHGVEVKTITAGDWDLSTEEGQLTARQLGSIARYESAVKSRRARAEVERRAAAGLVHGQTRTYGLSCERVGRERVWQIEEAEAAVIREAAERVLAGESALSITRDLNRREIPSPKGGIWRPQSLRVILISARVAGWREHRAGRGRSEAAAYGGGEFTAPAEWPAILDRPTVERLRRRLADPSRQRGPSGRTYLLSGGLARCAACGANLAGQMNSGRREYRCSVSGGGCGNVQIGADGIEEYVVEAVRAAHANGLFDEEVRDAGADSGASEAWALAEHLRAEVEQLSADKGSGLITRAEWLAQREPLLARLAAAETDLARRQEVEQTALLAGGLAEFDRAWAEDKAAGNLSRMRARLAAALGEVRVAKAVKGRNRFDADRISFPEWRDAPSAA